MSAEKTTVLNTTVVTQTVRAVTATYNRDMNRLRLHDPVTGSVLILTDGAIYGVTAQAPTGCVVFDDARSPFPYVAQSLVRAGLVEIVSEKVDTVGAPHTVYVLRVHMG